MSEGKRNQLVDEAIRLKKAWIMEIVFMGLPKDVHPGYLTIPDYQHYPLAQLRKEVADLRTDVQKPAKIMLVDKWTKRTAETLIPWLEKTYEAWIPNLAVPWEIGRVHEIEAEIGKLGLRRYMECPLYAQVLAQGIQGVAIRHPEYHLARDLALQNNLFFDCARASEEAFRLEKEKMVITTDREKTTEADQSFARSVILICFNLIESFVSGLAAEFLLATPDVEADLRKKLEDTGESLRKRFGKFPRLITGNENAMRGTEKLVERLFGECKQRRDSFVHCTPGPKPSAYGGYVKEEMFHDPGEAEVRETVSLTVEAISTVWEIVYSRKGPRWLPNLDEDGLFPKSNFSLTLNEQTSSE